MRICDTTSGAELANLQGSAERARSGPGRDNYISQIAVGPDGRWLTTAHDNIYLWNVDV